jgi:hypothetical protein
MADFAVDAEDFAAGLAAGTSADAGQAHRPSAAKVKAKRLSRKRVARANARLSKGSMSVVLSLRRVECRLGKTSEEARSLGITDTNELLAGAEQKRSRHRRFAIDSPLDLQLVFGGAERAISRGKKMAVCMPQKRSRMR